MVRIEILGIYKVCLFENFGTFYKKIFEIFGIFYSFPLFMTQGQVYDTSKVEMTDTSPLPSFIEIETKEIS